MQVFPDGPRLLLTGRDTGVRVADVAETLIEVALRFVKIRETAWRVTELADIGELQSVSSWAHPFGRHQNARRLDTPG